MILQPGYPDELSAFLNLSSRFRCESHNQDLVIRKSLKRVAIEMHQRNKVKDRQNSPSPSHCILLS